MATRNIRSKISIFNYTKANTKASGLRFTSAASETTDGKEYNKHDTPVASIAEAEKRTSEMARKIGEQIDGAEGRGQVTKGKGTGKANDTMKATWNTAEKATKRVAGKAKEVVDEYVDVMRPAEEHRHREKLVDQREINAVRRPLDKKKP